MKGPEFVHLSMDKALFDKFVYGSGDNPSIDDIIAAHEADRAARGRSGGYVLSEETLARHAAVTAELERKILAGETDGDFDDDLSDAYFYMRRF